MKKLLTMLLALTMIVSMLTMVACNDTPDTPDIPDPGSSDVEQPGNNDDPVTPPEGEVSEDQKDADKVIERIDKIGEITQDTWEDNENKIEYARKYYDKLTDAQKALIDAELVKKLEDAEASFAAFRAAAEKAEGLTVNKIVTATAVVDGQLDGYYVMGTTLTLGNTSVRFTYDKENLYIFAENKTAKDGITLQLAHNAVTVGSVVLTAEGVTVQTADATDADQPQQVMATEGGYLAEVAVALELLGLDEDYFEDKEVGVSFACGSESYTGYDSPEDFERFYTADSAFYNYIATGTPEIDGAMDELYLQAHAITLSQDVVKSFTKKEQNLGGGWQGDQTLTDAADMHTTFRFAVDDTYLYIVEHRFDLYPVYGSTAFNKPFRADGSLLWFSKNGDLGAGIAWNRALKAHDGPVFGLFFDNGQTGAIQKNWEFAVRQYATQCEYIMELKVPLADLELTRADFDEAKISFTFCSADIIDSEYNADTFSWTGTGYQMNYIGVNTWQDADGAQTDMPMLLINPTGDVMSSMPELMGEWAPELAKEFDVWDAMSGIEEMPFDTFPVDAETGYLQSEWNVEMLNTWYELLYANKLRYSLNRDELPALAEGVTLTNNSASRNSNVGFYCDPIGSNVVVSVDLTRYQDALITVATSQNYVLEVSRDGENWTELYNYVTVQGAPITSNQNFVGYAIDSTLYAADSDIMYVRIGQAKTDAAGWGGTFQSFTVFYN